MSRSFVRKLYHSLNFIRKQIDYYNKTAHKFFVQEISFGLPSFLNRQKEKRSIIASLVTIFIGLADEGISSFLHSKKQKALKQSFHSYGK